MHVIKFAWAGSIVHSPEGQPLAPPGFYSRFSSLGVDANSESNSTRPHVAWGTTRQALCRMKGIRHSSCWLEGQQVFYDFTWNWIDGPSCGPSDGPETPASLNMTRLYQLVSTQEQ